jgi:ABC-type transport system involved in cytochrome bd biosynthesis fused ATPase/permease subunit
MLLNNTNSRTFTRMSVISTTWRILKQSGGSTCYLTTYLLDVIIDVIATYCFIWLSNASEKDLPNVVRIYLFIMVMHPVCDFMFKNLRQNIIKTISGHFRSEETHRYATLSLSSKNKMPFSDFRSKLAKACYAIEIVLDWGINEITSLISTFFSCIMIFWNNGMAPLLFLLVVLNAAAYKFYINKLHIGFNEERKKARDESNQISDLMALVIPLFQNDQKTPDFVLGFDARLREGQTQIGKKWSHISTVTSIINKIGLILVCMAKNQPQVRLLLIIKGFNDFARTFGDLMRFLNQYQQLGSDFTHHEEQWDRAEFKPKPVQLPLPEKLIVRNIQVSLNNFNFSASSLTFDINKGEKVLIQGPSGHGKSMFLNLLTGRIPGMNLVVNKPENYFDSFVIQHQAIKEDFPTKKTNLRQLFFDELDNGLILQCMKICCVDDWFENWSSEKKHSAEMRIQISEDKSSPFDRKIEGNISGGEKTRLALATVVYRLIKEQKPVVIWDEPEQGSDAKTAYRLVKNILQNFPNVTMFIVCHLETIHRRHNWTQRLWIEKTDGSSTLRAISNQTDMF